MKKNMQAVAELPSTLVADKRYKNELNGFIVRDSHFALSVMQVFFVSKEESKA